MASFLGYVFLAILFGWGLMLYLTVGGTGALSLAAALICLTVFPFSLGWKIAGGILLLQVVLFLWSLRPSAPI